MDIHEAQVAVTANRKFCQSLQMVECLTRLPLLVSIQDVCITGVFEFAAYVFTNPITFSSTERTFCRFVAHFIRQVRDHPSIFEDFLAASNVTGNQGVQVVRSVSLPQPGDIFRLLNLRGVAHPEHCSCVSSHFTSGQRCPSRMQNIFNKLGFHH